MSESGWGFNVLSGWRLRRPGPRLRVILRSPDLRCASLPGMGRVAADTVVCRRRWQRMDVRPVSSAVGGWLPGLAACAVMAEQVAGLAVERLAEPCQGGEPDRPGVAVLQDGQVDHADADPLG